MDNKANSINWFEISVSDITRATNFYENIFGIKMETMEIMGMKMAMFPAEPGSGKANGALVQSDMHKPSEDGVKVYLNGDPDMSPILDKINGAGGNVTMPKTDIGQGFGFMAFFIDTEGNSIGLHSNG
ncbi:MAG: VOC family protein [Chitinophagales bacterium]